MTVISLEFRRYIDKQVMGHIKRVQTDQNNKIIDHFKTNKTIDRFKNIKK